MSTAQAPSLLPLLLLAGLPVQGPGDAPPSRELLLRLTETPRLAGTCGSRTGADFVAGVLEDAGFEVEIDEREVLLSLPRNIEFSIYEDAFAETPLSERIERFDPDAVPPGDVPKCNGWSASGTVRGRVVHAGRGLRDDFERLKSLGIELRGAVALIRYGGSYRGIKVDLATEYGCAAALLYSDPDDDGPGKGETWPAGPWKPDWEAQRGSINPIASVPGDPSTPGWPSPHPGDPDARRASPEAIAAALPTIPCIPIGWRDAKVLIERLKTVETKDQGGNAVREPLGPGPVQARLVVDQPRDYRVIRNVIGRLRGESEATVIGGAHRDAWVRGANDDGAGTVAMLRAAQRLGKRAEAGWKPPCTIAIAFWDAEEFGLIGSTEWGEANADWLREHAVAYVNADTGVSGPRFRGAGGTPGMLSVLRDVLERIPAAERDPEHDEGGTPANLWEEWREGVAERARRRGAEDAEEVEPRLGLAGSGSDFAVFVHHLNIPALEPGFGGGGGGGGYHTTFDDFLYVERYVDPGFVGHELAGRLLAELLAELAERGAGAFSPAEAAAEWSRRAHEAKDDLGEPVERLAEAFREAEPDRDMLLGRFEEGLPGRAWFKNRLWAPGLEDGYGSETFPLLRAAAREGEDQIAAAVASWIDALGVEADASPASAPAPPSPPTGH